MLEGVEVLENSEKVIGSFSHSCGLRVFHLNICLVSQNTARLMVCHIEKV